MAEKILKEKIYTTITKYGIKVVQKLFPEYFAKQPLQPTDRYIEYNFVARQLPPPPATILDVGCSGSYFPLILAGLGYRVTGLDLRCYPLKVDNFSFVKGDVIKHKGEYDAVTCISTLEHIGVGGRYGVRDDREADKKAVRNIMKLTDKAVFTLPFGKAKILPPYTRIYDYDSLVGLFRGYRVSEAEFYYHEDWSKMDTYEIRDNDAYKHDICCLCVEK